MIETARALLSNPDLVTALGWMLAAAMVVGSVLDEGGRQLLSWLAAGIVYTIFYEIALSSLLGMSKALTMNGAFLMITTTVYCSGLSLGWLISFLAKRYVRRKEIT